MTPEPTHSDLLELDVDTRISELWAIAADVFSGDALNIVGRFMRAAYGVGYADAACGDRTLYADNGYELPRAT